MLQIGDRLFYTLALGLAAGMIVLALLPAMQALPSGPVSVGDRDYSEVTVEGLQLNRMVAGGEAEIELFEADDLSLLRIETGAGTLADDPTLGPHFPLAADLEVQYSGFTIEITVRARPAQTWGARQIKVNYSTGRDGESGWKVFDLAPDFRDYSFRYDVPVKSGQNALDYLAIRPVTPEKRRVVEVERLTIRRLARWAPLPD
jgi:hypothetical protein